MRSPLDAIVIGAGINGLTAAYLLGLAGQRVLVLERAAQPGGCLRTLELTRPGFKHDFGAMNLGQFVGSPFFARHGDALRRAGAEFVTAERPYASVFPDGRFVGVSTDLAATRRSIEAISPRDARAWTAWGEHYDRIGSSLASILASPPRSLDAMLKDVTPAVAQMLQAPLRDTLAKRFESEEVRGLVAAWGMHLDFAPEVAGGSLIPFLESNADARAGIALARGGSGAVTRALAGLVEQVGGEVRLKTPVARIVVEGNRAAGVRLDGGEVIRGRNAVLASVTPPALLRLAGEALPPALAESARGWRFGPGTLMIHLALSDLPPWRAEEARRFFYVHVNSRLDQLSRAYEDANRGLLPEEPLLVVGQPTVCDPTRAPAGAHTLWIMVRAVPARVRGDGAGVLRGGDWADLKEAYADRVLAQVEQHAPGLGRAVLGRAVLSPDDLEAANPNLVGGDLLAGSHHLDQWYDRRPFPGHAGHGTSIEGLYVLGAATWPGAGAAPGSGWLLAQRLLGAA
jgi:phytoene dehydrogenase-like protein